MDRLWKMLGLLALLWLVPVMGHQTEHLGRGFTTVEGRGYLPEGRGFSGRGGPVAMWSSSEQKEWASSETGVKNGEWSPNKRHGAAQP